MDALRWLRLGDLLVVTAESGEEIGDSLWASLVAEIDVDDVGRVLVWSTDSTWIRFAVGQMRVFARIVVVRRQRVAVVTTHRHTRALVSAATWVGADVSAHENLTSALISLDVAADTRTRIQRLVAIL
jgi:hypothetical protein